MTEFLDVVTKAGLGELAESMGVELLEASADRLVARMPVAGNRQPFGLLHGGASVVLAETVGSIAANLHAGPERVAVGIEISATHHRSATSGHVTATATAISLGRTLATYEIVIVDDEDKRVCTSRLTCMLRDRPGG
jgi:1,4-dihydroxy-2-naphthoyl-CoA hydrolase